MMRLMDDPSYDPVKDPINDPANHAEFLPGDLFWEGMMRMHGIPDFAEFYPDGICRCDRILLNGPVFCEPMPGYKIFSFVVHEKRIWFWQARIWRKARWHICWETGLLRPEATKEFQLMRWCKMADDRTITLHLSFAESPVEDSGDIFPPDDAWRLLKNERHTITCLTSTNHHGNLMLSFRRTKVSPTKGCPIITKAQHTFRRIITHLATSRLYHPKRLHADRLFSLIFHTNAKGVSAALLFILPARDEANAMGITVISPNHLRDPDQEIKSTPFQHLHAPQLRIPFTKSEKGKYLLSSRLVKEVA